MKLHKLLYCTQRESFAILDEPAFEGEMEGWKYGPVSREVRSEYYNGEILAPTKGGEHLVDLSNQTEPPSSGAQSSISS